MDVAMSNLAIAESEILRVSEWLLAPFATSSVVQSTYLDVTWGIQGGRGKAPAPPWARQEN